MLKGNSSAEGKNKLIFTDKSSRHWDRCFTYIILYNTYNYSASYVKNLLLISLWIRAINHFAQSHTAKMEQAYIYPVLSDLKHFLLFSLNYTAITFKKFSILQVVKYIS